jgi:uncharacterized protein (UPF0548 family)
MSSTGAPWWSLRAPTPEVIERFLQVHAAAPFSYAAVGASNTVAPAGYQYDLNRIILGRGERAFAAGCAALRAWKMFPAPWTKVTPAETSIRPGAIVAMEARALGLWWLNACKIVYLIDEAAPIRRWGFAYGTLPAHVEEGEERFSVEFHGDGTVWYDLRAFSRPRYWPVRLGAPLARRLQRRFVRESQCAMVRAVEDSKESA